MFQQFVILQLTITLIQVEEFIVEIFSTAQFPIYVLNNVKEKGSLLFSNL